MRKILSLGAAPLVLCGALAITPALAQNNNYGSNNGDYNNNYNSNGNNGNGNNSTQNQAQWEIKKAESIAYAMAAHPHLKQLMTQAKGIFFVTSANNGGFFFGGDNQGVLVVRNGNGSWTDPVFYDAGSVNFPNGNNGNSAEVAFLLMSNRAVNDFREAGTNGNNGNNGNNNRNSGYSNENNGNSGNNGNVALDPNAGLTMVNYSPNVQAQSGRVDVITWTNTGAGGVTVDNISWNQNRNQAFYGNSASPDALFNGTYRTGRAKNFESALPQ